MVTFDEYVRLRGPRLVRLARLLARDRDLAEDLVQEVLGKAFARWNRIVRGGDPDVYVRRMLINANVSWWRRRSSSELVTGDVPVPVDDRDIGERYAERDEAWRLVAQLPVKQRAAVILRRKRVRHVMLGTSLGLTTALTVVAAVVLLPRLPEVEPAPASPLARPPAAGPGDTNVLRLDVSDPGATSLWWRSAPGWELVEVGRVDSWQGSLDQYRVMRAPTEAGLDAAQAEGTEALPGNPTTEQTTVNGNPATLKLSGPEGVSDRWATLRWRHTDGSWYAVFIVFSSVTEPDRDRAAALQAAQWVRTDRAYRCLVDFRLAWVPPSSRLAGCELAIFTTHTRVRGVLIQAGDKSFTLRTDDVVNANPFSPNTTVEGKQVEAHNGGVLYVYGTRAVVLGPVEGSMDQADALRVIAGFNPSSDPVDNPLP